MSHSTTTLSVVVPIFNEEENLTTLHKEVVEALSGLPDNYQWEILLVDDGSTDRSVDIAKTLTPVTLIQLRKNFGQTAAFDAGFKAATGEIFVTMDGDLQNDPADIPRLLEKLNEGYDVVSGWRKNRQDAISKRITSRTANLLRKVFFADTIHDSGCALKAYRRECFLHLDLYGEMHRFIPALLYQQGFAVTEIVVNHRQRIHGKSKYGNLKRGTKSLIDMIAVSFWGRYNARPLHIFGSLGLGLTFVGLSIFGLLFILRLFFDVSLADRIWPIIGMLSILSGIQLFTIGIMTDLQSKIYFRSHGRMNYSVKATEQL